MSAQTSSRAVISAIRETARLVRPEEAGPQISVSDPRGMGSRSAMPVGMASGAGRGWTGPAERRQWLRVRRGGQLPFSPFLPLNNTFAEWRRESIGGGCQPVLRRLLQNGKTKYAEILRTIGLEKTNGTRSDYKTGPVDDGHSGGRSLGMPGERAADGAEGEPGDGNRAAADASADARRLAATIDLTLPPGALLSVTARRLSISADCLLSLPTLSNAVTA